MYNVEFYEDANDFSPLMENLSTLLKLFRQLGLMLTVQPSANASQCKDV